MSEMPTQLEAMIFTHTCTLMPWTPGAIGRDGWAKPTYVAGNELEDIACFFDDRGALEVNTSGGTHLIVVDNPLLLLPAGSSVDCRYKVRDIREGTTVLAEGPYEIKAVRFPGGYDHHIECTLERLNAD